MPGLVLFIKEAIAHPFRVGALFPSSKRLATGLVQQIPARSSGLIIELGAGTGAVTAALLHQTTPPQELLVIERSAKFAKHLTQRFPALTIIQGDAAQLQQLLADYSSTPIHTIVSGLPLRSLPADLVKTIGEEISGVLQKGSLFIQYTYSLWGKAVSPSKNLKLIHRQWVWRNLPPARIDVFCCE